MLDIELKQALNRISEKLGLSSGEAARSLFLLGMEIADDKLSQENRVLFEPVKAGSRILRILFPNKHKGAV